MASPATAARPPRTRALLYWAYAGLTFVYVTLVSWGLRPVPRRDPVPLDLVRRGGARRNLDV